MSEWSFRLAQPEEAHLFAKWAAENESIDQSDLVAGTKTKNPTVVVFVAEKDGVPVAFSPVYCQMSLAHLGFDPEAKSTDKLKSLEVLLDGVSAFAVQFGVREITTLSKEKYGIARWAVVHGFEKDERSLFKYDINKVLAEA